MRWTTSRSASVDCDRRAVCARNRASGASGRLTPSLWTRSRLAWSAVKLPNSKVARPGPARVKTARSPVPPRHPGDRSRAPTACEATCRQSRSHRVQWSSRSGASRSLSLARSGTRFPRPPSVLQCAPRSQEGLRVPSLVDRPTPTGIVMAVDPSCSVAIHFRASFTAVIVLPALPLVDA